jgi:hypothetical protein
MSRSTTTKPRARASAPRVDSSMLVNTIATVVSIIVGIGGLGVAIWQARETAKYYRELRGTTPTDPS